MQTYEPEIGERIERTATTICERANAANFPCKAIFNGIELVAQPGDGAGVITDRFHAEMKRRSDEYEASPEGIASAKRAEEFQKRAEASAAEGIKTFRVKDQPFWDKQVEVNSDGYGACCIRYAARWANLMERQIDAGKSLTAIADKCSHEADTEGITGFMYGAAVSILSKVWQHGEELRRWHNKETQLGDEGDKANETGGVLNPAMLSIGHS